jgi:hypothetical protein
MKTVERPNSDIVTGGNGVKELADLPVGDSDLAYAIARNVSFTEAARKHIGEAEKMLIKSFCHLDAIGQVQSDEKGPRWLTPSSFVLFAEKREELLNKLSKIKIYEMKMAELRKIKGTKPRDIVSVHWMTDEPFDEDLND